MAQLVVRNIEEDVKARLQKRAKRHGRSMEDEVRHILRNAAKDDKGTPNPLAGNVQFIYTFCSSQPCRTMHDFVLFGFNEVEHFEGPGRYTDFRSQNPRMAIDGVLNWKAGGSGIYMNYRFAQPTRPGMSFRSGSSKCCSEKIQNRLPDWTF